MNAEETRKRLMEVRRGANSASFQKRSIALLGLCEVVAELVDEVDGLVNGEEITAVTYEIRSGVDGDGLEVD